MRSRNLTTCRYGLTRSIGCVTVESSMESLATAPTLARTDSGSLANEVGERIVPLHIGPFATSKIEGIPSGPGNILSSRTRIAVDFQRAMAER